MGEGSPVPSSSSSQQRYKLIWRLLLISNLALGAYLFARARNKDTSKWSGKTTAPSTPASTSTTLPEERIQAPSKEREPISEDQQRELFKWLLQEKRKVKPKDPEEKKRIDEDKAILKQFIRAKTIPKI